MILVIKGHTTKSKMVKHHDCNFAKQKTAECHICKFNEGNILWGCYKCIDGLIWLCSEACVRKFKFFPEELGSFEYI